MKKVLFEYSNTMAYILTGFVFGISFFLLFINFYHYKDVNEIYVKQDSDYKNNQELVNKLGEIEKKLPLVYFLFFYIQNFYLVLFFDCP